MPGERIFMVITPDSMFVFDASVATLVGKQFGLLGTLIGATVGAVQNNSLQKKPKFVVSHKDIRSMSKHKSLLSGAGIMFELTSGSKFKIGTPRMAYGGIKKVYSEIADSIQKANQNIQRDTQIIT